MPKGSWLPAVLLTGSAVLVVSGMLWSGVSSAAADRDPAVPVPRSDPTGTVAPAATPPPKLEGIRLDRDRGRFAVAGRVVRTDPPLEFLAVTRGGFKAYESLLELDTDAVSFNVACILIGLETEGQGKFEHHFDRSPGRGHPVRITVEWTQVEGLSRVAGGSLLKVEGLEGVAEEWIYTGSGFAPDGVYWAERDGTLIGFVHDPASIIEHRAGLGLGNYGAVGADPVRCPAPGTPVTVIIENPTRQEEEKR